MQLTCCFLKCLHWNPKAENELISGDSTVALRVLAGVG